MRRASAVLDNEAAAVSSPEHGSGEILSTLLARCSQSSVYQPINNSQQQLHHSYIRDVGSFAQVANKWKAVARQIAVDVGTLLSSI